MLCLEVLQAKEMEVVQLFDWRLAAAANSLLLLIVSLPGHLVNSVVLLSAKRSHHFLKLGGSLMLECQRTAGFHALLKEA